MKTATRPTHAMNIRGLDPDVARRIKAAAGARGITLGEYLARLVALHDRVRLQADAGDAWCQTELKRLGLETVTR